jgi:lipopolysaccharide transport system ATP-binding protein
MKPIIKVEGVSKRYRIGARQEAYGSLRDALTGLVKAPVRRLKGVRRASGEHVWALKDVSFEVMPGEVVGILGHNGAGKSTLLKVLSRVTEPTEGRVELYGRVGSLLEVGTGFHPELTGRENIFLYGAILGMRRAEIARKFDEIVAFSEIERFIDTPVKHYSSGMYMRLAFSVPAHLEPEVMLLDEVLAVGDISFQKKCLNHMRRLKQNGMTILMVSHNMTAIQGTCERSLLLNGGTIVAEGASTAVVERFREITRQRERERAARMEGRAGETPPAGDVVITSFDMTGSDGESRRRFRFGEEARIRISLRAARRIESPSINLGIKRGDGVVVCNFNNWYDNFKIDFIEGECTLEGWLPPLRLIPHHYEIHVLVWQRRTAAADTDLNMLHPLAATTFGDFTVEGPPLTEGDGVFQEPARRWRLTLNGQQFDYDTMDERSLEEAYEQDRRPAHESL